MTPPEDRPVASVSLDLDDRWSYLKTHGDPEWRELPSYLPVFVPEVLAALERLGLRITFFVVGQDAALERNRELLRAITQSGHEVGNHSFHHEPWRMDGSRDALRAELAGAGEAIERASGQRPRGFRGPGFAWSANLLDVLEEAGYLYDASTLPTYLGPLARRYYLKRASLSEEAGHERRDLFGGFAEGRRPLEPYLWKLGPERRLLEIPVTTIPWLRTPFHLSYLLYLSRYSGALASAYLGMALRLCRLTGTEPSFLLHPLDLLGPEHAPELAFFPGMDLGAEHKRALFERVLGALAERFRLVTLGQHASLALAGELALREART